jgi:hypothetical protein
MVIYSRRSVFNTCSFFEEIIRKAYPTESVDYEIRLQPREWDRIGHDDLSINRCPKTPADVKKPFLFSHWKLGKRTPGDPNDCTGSHWFIEENLEIVLASEGVVDIHSLSGPSVSVPTQCASSTLVSAMLKVHAENAVDNTDVAVASAKATSTSTCSGMTQAETSTKPVKLDALCDELRDAVKTMQTRSKQEVTPAAVPPTKKLCVEGNIDKAERPWESTSHFPVSNLQMIRQHQNEFIQVRWLTPARRTWLKYLFNSAMPKKSTLQCYICEAYVKEHNIEQNVPALANPEGYLSTNMQTMREILRHADSTTHRAAIAEMKQAYVDTMGKCVKEWKEEKKRQASTTETITARMTRTVYTEVKQNIPLNSHNQLVDMQKSNGLNMGVHQYERTSARMVKVIYETDTLSDRRSHGDVLWPCS